MFPQKVTSFLFICRLRSAKSFRKVAFNHGLNRRNKLMNKYM